MSSAITIAGIGTAISGYGVAQQTKAAKEAAKAGAGSGVDIAGLDQQARALAKRNIEDSIALENQYSPETAALRTQATQALLPYAQGTDPLTSTGRTLRTSLYGDFADADNATLTRSALLDDTVNKARSDLALAGRLDTSTRNEISRRAAANAGAVGGGLGLGRDLSARDLGLSSNALLQQRLTNASNIGQQDQNFYNTQSQFGLANNAQRLNTANLISDLGNQDFARQFQLAQFGQSIARPESGLDATSLVNLSVGNQNAQNAAAQNAAAIAAQTGNAYMGLGGSLIGAGIGGYANRAGTTPTTPASTYTPKANLPTYNGVFTPPAYTGIFAKPAYTAPTITY
jgi:hypothetical protein